MKGSYLVVSFSGIDSSYPCFLLIPVVAVEFQVVSGFLSVPVVSSRCKMLSTLSIYFDNHIVVIIVVVQLSGFVFLENPLLLALVKPYLESVFGLFCSHHYCRTENIQCGFPLYYPVRGVGGLREDEGGRRNGVL